MPQKKGDRTKGVPLNVAQKKGDRRESSSSASPPATKKVVANKKTTKKKDLNAPNNTKSAFMLFSGVKHSEIKEANLEASFGDMGKLVRVTWKELPNSKKAEWEEKAKLEKVCYKKEMDGYLALPDDGDNKEDLGDNVAKVKKKLTAKRAKKDPNASKQPMNAYMLYSNSIRAKIREENPSIFLGSVAKQIGSQYKTICADEKAVWQSKADVAKEVYKKERTKYNLKSLSHLSRRNGTPSQKARRRRKWTVTWRHQMTATTKRIRATTM